MLLLLIWLDSSIRNGMGDWELAPPLLPRPWTLPHPIPLPRPLPCPRPLLTACRAAFSATFAALSLAFCSFSANRLSFHCAASAALMASAIAASSFQHCLSSLSCSFCLCLSSSAFFAAASASRASNVSASASKAPCPCFKTPPQHSWEMSLLASWAFKWVWTCWSKTCCAFCLLITWFCNLMMLTKVVVDWFRAASWWVIPKTSLHRAATCWGVASRVSAAIQVSMSSMHPAWMWWWCILGVNEQELLYALWYYLIKIFISWFWN